MNAKTAALVEQDLLAIAAACDDALAAGRTLPDLEDSASSAEVKPRLQRGLACMQKLRQLWPAADSALATSDESGALDASVPPARLTHLGRFAIKQELGRGGFGVVLLAHDPQLGRDVALKVPRTDALLDPDLRRRLQQEARAAAVLDHPNLVAVYEAGEVGAICYIASAYCPGPTLAAWLKARTEPVPHRDAAQLVLTLAGAVAHAHQRGIVHRDLKPANVLLVSGGVVNGGVVSGGVVSGEYSEENPPPVRHHSPLTTHHSPLTTHHSPLTSYQPKITDFGLAKDLTVNADAAGLTMSGAVVGTPAYMAPEQARGLSKDIGPAADIYALGTILYELLTDRPPFQAESILETLELVRSEEPLPPTRLQPRLPRDLETICLKCLHKAPGKRYASAHDLAADLNRFLEGKPILARPIGAVERFGKWVRRRPATAALILVSVAAVAVMAVGAVVFTQQVQNDNVRFLAEKLEADRQRTEAFKQTERAEKNKQDALAQSRLAVERWHDARHHLYNLQLARVALIFEREPMQALAFLEDDKTCPPELRCFIWGYYHRLCKRDRFTFTDHTTGVVSVALSPDGQTLAAGNGAMNDKGKARPAEIMLWDLKTGKWRATLTGHTDRVTALAFSRDGTTLASASEDKTVKLWDVATATEKHSFEGYPMGVNAVAFGPNDDLLATGYGSTVTAGSALPGAIKLWDLATRQEWKTLAGHAHWVNGLAFSPDGTLLASASGVFNPAKGQPTSGEFKLWDLSTGAERDTFRAHVNTINAVAFSPNGMWLACASVDRTVSLWDVKSGRQSRTLAGHPSGVNAVVFLRDDLLATASGDAIKLWNLTTGQESTVLRGHSDIVWSLAWHPGTNTLVSGSWDRAVKVWNHFNAAEQATLSRHASGPCSLAVSADDTILASTEIDAVQLWDLSTRKHIDFLRGHKGFLGAATFIGDRPRLATAGSDASIKLWDVKSRRMQTTVRVDRARGWPIACSADGLVLAFPMKDGSIKIWDIAKDAERAVLRNPGGLPGANVLVFAQDGKTLVAGGLDGTITYWDLAAQRVQWSVKGHRAAVIALEFAGRTPTLASASFDKTVKFWDSATGLELRTLHGNVGSVQALAFTRDGRTMASSNADKTIHLWDVRSAEVRATLRGHADAVTSLVFTNDNQTLISGSKDRTIKLWTVK